MALTDILQRIKEAFISSPELQQAYGFDPNRTFDEQFSELSLEANDINFFANAQFIIEGILNADKNTIQSIIDQNRIGTGVWYVSQAKLFQWNETVNYFLQVDPVTGVIGYNITAPEDRIISQAAFYEGAGLVVLKVAAGKPGDLHPITDDQLSNLVNYINQIKVAGIRVDIVNLPADKINLRANVFFNPAYNTTNLKQAIIDSLNLYSVETNFNGVVLRNAVIDAIQRVPGVIDVEIAELQALVGYMLFNIGRSYATASGYFNFNTENNLPEINLIPA